MVDLFLYGFHLISAVCLALQHGIQFSFNHLLAQRRQMVDEHLSFQMVELVLHHACQVAFDNLIVRFQILVQVLHTYFVATLHRLMNTGKAQAPLVHRNLLTGLSEFERAY